MLFRLSNSGSVRKRAVPQIHCAASGPHRIATVAVFFCVLLLPVRSGQAQSTPLTAAAAAKLAPDLAQQLIVQPAEKRIPVIVCTSGKPLSSLLQSTQQTTPELLTAAHCRALDSSGTYAASLTAAQLILLLQHPDVWHVSPDRPLTLCQDYATTTVGATIAWNSDGLSGAGVTVAVLDTGIYAHQDLISSPSRLVGWQDLVNGSATPYDDNGHGTHVTGIVAGDGAASVQGGYNSTLTWMAPRVNVVGVKVLDKTGSGSVSTVIAGINWCITNQQQYHIRILNLSLGHPVAESYRTDPLCQACEQAWKAGILVVCAAGNMGRSVPDDPNSAPAYGTIISPGNDPQVLTVGATNTQGTPTILDDTIASYSSRGPSAIDFVLKPDIIAPGNCIDSLAAPGSTLFLDYPGNQINPATFGGKGPVQYFQLSGTSMASPVVAGAAALLLQANSTLTPDTIKARLMVSALKVPYNDPFTYGAGYLNVPAALASRVTAPLGAFSPFTAPANNGTIQMSPNPANGSLVWGDNLIWGDNKTAACCIFGTAAWNANGISTNSIWNGQPTTAGMASSASLEAILIGGDR